MKLIWKVTKAEQEARERLHSSQVERVSPLREATTLVVISAPPVANTPFSDWQPLVKRKKKILGLAASRGGLPVGQDEKTDPGAILSVLGGVLDQVRGAK